MKPVFADTFYFLALLNSKDESHARAWEFSKSRDAPLVTTAWILTELANALAGSAKRQVFRQLLDEIENHAENQLIAASQSLFDRGVKLYDARPDKQWSLTDCISFVVMQERGIAEALTGDHHFEQAGFIALFKE